MRYRQSLKIEERESILLLGRTIIRIRSPRLEASSQQDNVGKGSRQNRSVTLGKGLAQKKVKVSLF